MRVMQKDGFQVIGLKVETRWEEFWEVMPTACETFRSRYDNIPHRIDDSLMDICLERKDGMGTQLICAEVDRADTVPDGMEAVEIPAQEYLHLRHDGSLAEIAGSFASMYAWAEQHGIPADDFKIDAGYLPNGERQPHDLYVRISSVAR